MATEPTPTDALLPCPFCGAQAHFEMDADRWEWVACESCGMQGNRSASLMDDCKPKLAEEWNRRAQPAPAASPVPRTADDLKEPKNGEQWRVEWWNESCRMLLPADKKLDSFQSYKNGTLMFTIKDRGITKGA